jgi:hypothetical protein
MLQHGKRSPREQNQTHVVDEYEQRGNRNGEYLYPYYSEQRQQYNIDPGSYAQDLAGYDYDYNQAVSTRYNTPMFYDDTTPCCVHGQSSLIYHEDHGQSVARSDVFTDRRGRTKGKCTAHSMSIVAHISAQS